jgi:hypothetical protein
MVELEKKIGGSWVGSLFTFACPPVFVKRLPTPFSAKTTPFSAKKAAGAFASLTTVPFAFQPKTTYPIKVIVADDLLTLFVSGKQQAQVKMDAFQNAAKFGLRDNSAPNRQPSWGNFQVTSP